MQNNNMFLSKMEDLVKEIVDQDNIPYYRIESSMELQGSDTVPVIRIISYFEDTVSKVAHVLAREFDLAVIKAEQKNGTWQDSFSAQQMHYQAGLKANRLELTEYKKWAGSKFEVRVCSMLQDAWAGMERELKDDAGSIPDEVKRDFYRMGAFLEMADLEFMKIKQQLTKKKSGDSIQPARGAMPALPEVARTAAPAAAPAPQPAPAAERPAPAQEEKKPVSLSSVDMSVDSFDALGINVNNIENDNDSTGHFADLLSTNINKGKTAETMQEEPAMHREQAVTQDKPTKEIDVNTSPQAGAAHAPDEVALNIDNVENFNLNVNGMIERTTEIINDNGHAEKKRGPSYEELHEVKKPVEIPMDENAPMTDALLKDYVQNSTLLREVDQKIAERAGAKVNDEVDIEGDVERLKFLKVTTLKQLHERITDNKDDIVNFAEKWIGKDNGGSFDSGISLFYLEYLLVGKKNDPAFAVEYVLKFISDNDYSARYIIPTYNSIRQAEQASSFAHLTLK